MAFAIALTMNAAAQLQTDTMALNHAIERFLGSGQMICKDTHWSHAMGQWSFKQTVEGETMQEPHALTELKDVFSQYAAKATTAYILDGEKSVLPFNLMKVKRQDNFYKYITGHFLLGQGMNLRMLVFSEGGKDAIYGLEWRIVPVTDHNGRSWCTCEGELFRFDHGTWNVDSYTQYDAWEHASSLKPMSQGDMTKYENISSQMKFITERFASNKKGSKEKDAAFYMIDKLCREYNGRLTKKQYENLKKITQPITERADETQKRIYADAFQNLLEKHVHSLPLKYIRQMSCLSDEIFPSYGQAKMMFVNYELQDMSQLSVTQKVTGKAKGKITIQPVHPYMEPYETNRSDSSFYLTEDYIKDQLLRVSDAKGNSMMIFADGTDVDIDIKNMVVNGSALNNRFAEVQRQIKAYRQEMRKYAYLNHDGSYDIIDEKGYKDFYKEIHQFRLRLIEENTDNLIPAWILAESFLAMDCEELSRFMVRGRVYSDNIALQPVWSYYEGLQKRKPGMEYTDIACTDTDGQQHRLSEYIGHGDYVVLHFWQTTSSVTRKGAKYCKQIARKYKDRNLRVVGMAFDKDKEEWKRYVKKRDLAFDHLAASDVTSEINFSTTDVAKAYGITALPETIVFDPDGRILCTGLEDDDLKAYLQQIFGE